MPRDKGSDLMCERCGNGDGTQFCWYCQEGLCYPCWDAYGHCGHPEADALNEWGRARG